MNENVNVCITPKGDKPVLHFSQFDNERVFTVTVLADDGESAAVLTGLDIEFRLRKTDSHVVTIAPESVADNVITFKTTEQLCACCGQNIASVVLMKDDLIISTLVILVDIQRDILSGGLTSESDIRNLTTQVEQIVPEVIGDDYYNKQEVDDLLAEHTFDPTNYYNKADVDGLLADKADADDVYTKTETDNLLADKADSDDVMTKVIRNGITGESAYYRFDNNCVSPMDNIECAVTAVQSGSGTPSPDNVRPISGHSSCTITVADSDDTPVNTCTVSFGQTVYGGVTDVTNGKLTLTHGYYEITGAENWAWAKSGTYSGGFYTPVTSVDAKMRTPFICTHAKTVLSISEYEWGTCYCDGSFNFRIMQASDTVQDWINYLASQYSNGTPVSICYELATPIEITFTPATTDTINGHNKVSSSTGNMQSLTYFSDVNSDLVYLIRACMI